MTGRHAVGAASQGYRGALLIWALGVSVVLGLLFTVGGLGQALVRAPFIGADCPSDRLPTTQVTLTVAPEVQEVVKQALEPVARERFEGRCLTAMVTAEQPAATVAGASGTPAAQPPDVWVPDSSVWLSRVPWQTTAMGSIGSSPVVIATSRQTVTAAGWDRTVPTWQEALTGKLPLAVPDLTSSAPGLAAVISLWQSLGKGEQAQNALAATVLATGRAGVPTQEQALSDVETGSEFAPLLATSDQAVTAHTRAVGSVSALVAVHPTGGSPQLDYPLMRVARPSADSARGAAVDAVLAALRSPATRARMTAAGFEAAPAASAPPTTPVTAAAATSDTELAGLMGRITALAAPSRILVVIDQSGSMAAPAGDGSSRIVFAGTSAKIAGRLLPDRAQVGVWAFSRDIDGTEDHREILAVRPLGSKLEGASQREAVNTTLAELRLGLGGNGTAVYATAVQAMKKMNTLYDPRAGNAVVLFTDGADENPGGPSLEETVAQLRTLYDPAKPVRLICVGIGPDADMAALQQLAAAGGGLAQKATDPQVLPKVLFEVMNRRES